MCFQTFLLPNPSLHKLENPIETLSSSKSPDSPAAVASTSIETIDKSDPLSIPIVGKLFQRSKDVKEDQPEVLMSSSTIATTVKYDSTSKTVTNEALVSRGGSTSAVETSTVNGKKRSSSISPVSSMSSSSSTTPGFDMTDTYIIETPLFPIILPKSFEPKTASHTTQSSAAASISSLEISVAIPEDLASSSSSTTATKPSSQLLTAMAQPLLPKSLITSFTGRELYYPETIQSLSQIGMKLTLDNPFNEYINWVGEKKTDTFVKEYGQVINNAQETTCGHNKDWYDALDSSQEVLVWAGKFKVKDDGYGAELPIIKSTSIIHQSPKYLAELLMDSSKVQVYNKMSLGRDDVKVFQTGV